MQPDLAPHIWFVRSNRGSGSYPVRREGWVVVLKFIAGMIGWGIGAAVLATVGTLYGPAWVSVTAPIFFAVGAALSAWYFISTARAHTAYDVTYNDYMNARRAKG